MNNARDEGYEGDLLKFTRTIVLDLINKYGAAPKGLVKICNFFNWRKCLEKIN